MHGATCVYFVFITRMRGGEGLDHKVSNPITELVVTRCDEASLIVFNGKEDIKCRATSITMVW